MGLLSLGRTLRCAPYTVRKGQKSQPPNRERNNVEFTAEAFTAQSSREIIFLGLFPGQWAKFRFEVAGLKIPSQPFCFQFLTLVGNVMLDSREVRLTHRVHAVTVGPVHGCIWIGGVVHPRAGLFEMLDDFGQIIRRFQREQQMDVIGHNGDFEEVMSTLLALLNKSLPYAMPCVIHQQGQPMFSSGNEVVVQAEARIETFLFVPTLFYLRAHKVSSFLAVHSASLRVRFGGARSLTPEP